MTRRRTVTRRWTACLLVASVLAPLLALSAPAPPAVARTSPPTIDHVEDLGPLMIDPWHGKAPWGVNYDQGLWTSYRDCGLSTKLSDGRTLWVFCDTALFDERNIKRFNASSNSAAIASLSDPLVMRDTVGDGRVVQLVDRFDYYDCHGYHATWPASVVTLPDDDNNPRTDRVLVYFQAFCLGIGPDGKQTSMPQDIGVAEYDYDASQQPKYIKATTVNARLFRGDQGFDFEHGGVLVRDGGVPYVYLFGCDDQGCFTRRVQVSADPAADLARVGDPYAYETWTANGWAKTGLAKRIFTGDRTTLPGPPYPVSVAWLPDMKRFAMVYTTWPGYQRTGMVRLAEHPEGPWSEPVSFALPGCEVLALCYALNAHTGLSDPTHLGITYIKWNAFVGFGDGAYHHYGRLEAAKVPLAPARTAAAVLPEMTYIRKTTPFLFEIQNGSLAYKWSSDATGWSGWLPLPGSSWKGVPAAAENADHQLELFATDTDGQVWRSVKATGGAWSAFAPVGGDFRSNGELAAVRRGDGRVVLFAADAAGVVHQRLLSGDFSPLPDAGASVRATKGLAAAMNADNTIALFAVGAGGVVHTVSQSVYGGWSPRGWVQLVWLSPVKATGVAATSAADGRVRVFVPTTGNQVLQVWQKSAATPGQWSTFGYWPVLRTYDTSGGVSAFGYPDGRVGVFSVGADWITEQYAEQSDPAQPTSFGDFTNVPGPAPLPTTTTTTTTAPPG